jgi:hypothetical protein
MVAVVVAVTLAAAGVPSPGDPRAYDGATETALPEAQLAPTAAPAPAPVPPAPTAAPPEFVPPPAPRGFGLGWLVLSGITFTLGPAAQILAWKEVGTPTCVAKDPPHDNEPLICGPGLVKSALVITVPVGLAFATMSFAAASGHRRGKHDAWRDLYVHHRTRSVQPHWIAGTAVALVGCVGLGLGPAMIAGVMPGCANGCPAGLVPAGFVVTNLGIASLGAGLGLLAYAGAYHQHRTNLPQPPVLLPTASRDSFGFALSGRF